MSLITWQFNLVILYDVLLDDRIACCFNLALSTSFFVEVRLRNESCVAWDVCSSLNGTDV